MAGQMVGRQMDGGTEKRVNVHQDCGERSELQLVTHSPHSPLTGSEQAR